MNNIYSRCLNRDECPAYNTKYCLNLSYINSCNYFTDMLLKEEKTKTNLEYKIQNGSKENTPDRCR
jgi:hypothetical protein